MSADIKVTAIPALPAISDRLTVRGPLQYTAWPGSPFLELREGDELFNLVEHSEKATAPAKTYARVMVKRIQLRDGVVDIGRRS